MSRTRNAKSASRAVKAVGAVMIGLLVFAACDDGAEDVVDTNATTTTEPDETTTTSGAAGTTATRAGGPDDLVELTQSCENERDGYRLSYPADWFTNEGDVEPPCRFFDIEPVVVAEGTEPDEPVVADVEPVSFERATEPDRTGTVLAERTETVADRDAVRVEIEATGEGLYNEGTLITSWYVELGGEQTFIGTALASGGASYEEAQLVLDAMIETLEIIEVE